MLRRPARRGATAASPPEVVSGKPPHDPATSPPAPAGSLDAGRSRYASRAVRLAVVTALTLVLPVPSVTAAPVLAAPVLAAPVLAVSVPAASVPTPAALADLTAGALSAGSNVEGVSVPAGWPGPAGVPRAADRPAPAGVPRAADRPAPAGVPGRRGTFRPGSWGLADPYYPTDGNGGYDVRHYDLAIRYQPATDNLAGQAVIDAVATQDLSSFNLDLIGLTVDQVRVNGRRAWFTRVDQELIVVPARGLPQGRRFTVAVTYHGVPKSSALAGLAVLAGFLHTADGAVVAGQPHVSSLWYPVNDHPLDKATYSFAITVPEGLEAICNGVPLGRHTAYGWTTWWWAETNPMISYLATATIGQFRLSITRHNGRPMVIAVDETLPVTVADDAMARTGEITDFLESRFGPYPFSSNGGIVAGSPVLRFALENQTRPVYARSFFEVGPTNNETYVIAHELAHQWFGDSVALHNWDDIWLNEGFATYAEWLWSEHLGEETPQQVFDVYYAKPMNAGHWAPPPGDPGTGDLFDHSVYTRGAMTLHALRVTVGEAAFDRIVRSWYAANRDRHGSTEQFIALAESVSGEQLDSLFHSWLFTDTKPPYPTRQS